MPLFTSGSARVRSSPAVILLAGDLFGTDELVALPGFNAFDEVGGVEQAVVRTGAEPGEASAERLNAQVAVVQVGLVDTGKFQFATGRRLDRPGNIDGIIVVEVQPGDRVAALRTRGLFFDRDGKPIASNSTIPRRSGSLSW